MIPNPRDMTPAESNAFNSVAADDVERELALRHAAELADQAARQRAADGALQAIEGPRAALVASDEAERRPARFPI